MPNHPTPQEKLKPQYGTELLLLTVGNVLLVVVLVAIASTSVALIVLAIVATSALAVVIAAVVGRMTSDPGEGRALPNPASRPHDRPRIRRRAAPGTAREMFSRLAYAPAPHDNGAALAQEAQRRRDRAIAPAFTKPSRSYRHPGR
jgi:hypothetical protein